MKGYSLHAVNDLRYEKLEYPECTTGWCVVKVKAAGICSSDIPRVYTKGTYHFPTIPGHEFSGVVDKVADSENENLVGKKVGIFPLIPCRKCQQCKDGHYEMCSNYDYVGSRRDPLPFTVIKWKFQLLNRCLPFTPPLILKICPFFILCNNT